MPSLILPPGGQARPHRSSWAGLSPLPPPEGPHQARASLPLPSCSVALALTFRSHPLALPRMLIFPRLNHPCLIFVRARQKEKIRQGKHQWWKLGPSWMLCSERLWTAGREHVGRPPRRGHMAPEEARKGSPCAVLLLSWGHLTCAKPLSSCPTPCDPTDCSPPGSSVHGILQVRILAWVAMPTSRKSSQPRGQTCVSLISCIGRWVLYH